MFLQTFPFLMKNDAPQLSLLSTNISPAIRERDKCLNRDKRGRVKQNAIFRSIFLGSPLLSFSQVVENIQGT